jgi:hypothetical protein
MRMPCACCLLAVGLALAWGSGARAGEKLLECRVKGEKPPVGEVYFDLAKHAVTRTLKDPTGPARACNEKYPNACHGDCWGCDNRAARNDECWDSAGEKHVPFWE